MIKEMVSKNCYPEKQVPKTQKEMINLVQKISETHPRVNIKIDTPLNLVSQGREKASDSSDIGYSQYEKALGIEGGQVKDESINGGVDTSKFRSKYWDINGMGTIFQSHTLSIKMSMSI